MNKHYSCIILLIMNHYFICCNDPHRNNKLHGYQHKHVITKIYLDFIKKKLRLNFNTYMHKENH